MTEGIRPKLYTLTRLAGGDYLSLYTQIAWKEFKAGWIAAGGRED